MTWKILNKEALETALVIEKPFPYLIIDNILQPEVLLEVVKTFPKLEKRGSFPLDAVQFSGAFETLMQELQDTELKEIIAAKFKMDLKNKPCVITLRGHTDARDGNIHTDSSSKLITLLLYLNPNWQAEEGRLRLLYNKKELAPYAEEIAPEAGRCLIFEVNDNCWHGHTVFIGERKSIQLNYVVSNEAKHRHLKRHLWSSFIKRLFSKKHESSTY